MAVTDDNLEQFQPRPPEGLPQIDHETIATHLRLLSSLDRNRLERTLLPHRQLPAEDPARYLIDAHTPQTDTIPDKKPLTGPYALGVVFARSLTMSVGQDGDSDILPPIVTELNPDKKQVVDTYLERSARKSVRRLTRHGEPLHPELDAAISIFAERSKLVAMDIMFSTDSVDELKRGAHDYFSVITLLAAADGEEKRHMRRMLGGSVALMGAGLALAQLLPGRNAKPDSTI